MPAQRLKKYLDDNSVKYVVVTHSPAYTAQEIAASAHIPGKELAKTVIIKLNGIMAMAVVPASYHVELAHLKELTDADSVELATEKEFSDMFPGCDVGAMPPFGTLYGMEVYVAGSLADDNTIAFNAGSHRELIKMAYADFGRLVKPKVLEFSEKNH